MAHPSAPSSSSNADVKAAPSPLLQRALASLMVDLEDELLRYRQSRDGSGPVPVGRRPLKFRGKPRPAPSLISLKSPASQAAGPVRPGAATVATPPPPPPNPWLHTSAYPQPSYGPATETTSSPQAGQSLGSTLMPYQPMPQDYLESSEMLLDSAPAGYEEPDSYNEPDYQPSLTRQLATPLGIGALLLLLVGSASFGYLVMSPDAAQHLRNHALLKAFQPNSASDEALTQGDAAESGVSPGLSGIGPDLSEQEFSNLDLNRISSLPTDSTAPTNQALPAEAESDLASEKPGVGNDRLASDRPSELGAATMQTQTITALPSARPPSPTVARAPRPSTPSAPPSGAGASPPATAQPTARAPQPLQATPPAASAAPPQPLATNSAPPRPPAPLTQPAANSVPPASPNHYVVTDYSGSESLESARRVVGDAYVRDFGSGSRIQMGAFSQESSAQNLVNQLQQQGIPAQVYTP